MDEWIYYAIAKNLRITNCNICTPFARRFQKCESKRINRHDNHGFCLGMYHFNNGCDRFQTTE